MELNSENVRKLFDYIPETGYLIKLERGLEWFNETKKRSREQTCAQWNSGNANEICNSPTGNGYIRVCVFGRYYGVHRIIWLWMTGEWPKEDIDHKNGIRDDNRWENLESVTRQGNMKNLCKQTNKTSKYMGVCLRKSGKWQASITINNRKKHIGNFVCEFAAAVAYKKAAREADFNPNHGRAPGYVRPD